MSQWTGWTAEGTTGARQFAQINGRLLHKDKEELASELNGLKIQNNIQQEEIKLLKTEIGKLKKRGGVYLPSAKVQASHAQLATNKNIETMIIDPYDLERLKEELTNVKKELTDIKEENRVLKSQNEQYKKRATYAKTKFNEVKSNQEATAKEAATNSESKYRLKNTELKKEMHHITQERYKAAEEASQLKVKLLQALQMNKAQREENEKTSKQMRKLFARLEELEKKEEDRRDSDLVRQQIEGALSKQSQEDEEGNKEVRFQLDSESEDGEGREISEESSNLSRSESKPNNDQTANSATKNMVAATISAWNSCPLIVRKQLEEQAKTIREQKELLKEYELKLRLKKNDYDRVQGIEAKKEIMQHKERAEALFRQKLDDEKRKMLKGRLEEFEAMVAENKNLKEEIGRLRVSMAKLSR